MKEQYVELDVEVLRFEPVDIITTSDTDDTASSETPSVMDY